MTAARGSAPDIELRLLIDAIYLKYHYDFREYAAASLKRRLKSAMPKFDCDTLSQLQGRVLHEPATFRALLDFLTVPVSEMFRDPGYFKALRERVVPILRTYPSLKLWVAGCSTGEEAYSLAILLIEEMDRRKNRWRVQIFGTDLDSLARRIGRRNPIARRERRKLDAPAREEHIAGDV